jgi:hypothetical protein
LSSDGLKVRSVQSQPIGAVSFTFNPDAGEKIRYADPFNRQTDLLFCPLCPKRLFVF